MINAHSVHWSIFLHLKFVWCIRECAYSRYTFWNVFQNAHSSEYNHQNQVSIRIRILSQNGPSPWPQLSKKQTFYRDNSDSDESNNDNMVNAHQVPEMYRDERLVDWQERLADQQAVLLPLVLLIVAMILWFIVGRGY